MARWSQRERIADLDPWNGETLLTVTSASSEDVDEAYHAAREAQGA